MKQHKLRIGNQQVDSKSGKTRIITSLVTGEPYAEVSQAGADDVATAIEAAKKGFAEWSAMPPSAREGVLNKAAQVLASRQSEVVEILQNEGGSAFGKSMFEVGFTQGLLTGAAGECRRVSGQTFATDKPGVFSFSVRAPLGIIAGISPFNFPLILSTKKLALALAAGNAFILKPSEATPLLGLKIGEIMEEAGLPDGALSVLPGEGSEPGQSLIADPAVKMITFTGSTKVGKLVASQAAEHMTRCTLELGGKNPFIVLKDADIDYAVNAAVFGLFIHQGQICMAGSRLIVEAEVYDEFCEKLAARASRLKHGSIAEPDTVIGPLIRESQIDQINTLVDQAKAQGARLLTGGSSDGQVYQATLLADVTPDMEIFHEECFGPVGVICKANDHEHALELANDNAYGLSAALHTNDLRKAHSLAARIQSGMVHVNGPTVRDEAHIPFGGVKNSGMGREGGRFSIEDMTELKWITVQGGQDQFPF